MKGATTTIGDIEKRGFGISIHAPVKGATITTSKTISYMLNFNPRTREGCDSVLDLLPAPYSRYFNPRTREGCDEAGGNHYRS